MGARVTIDQEQFLGGKVTSAKFEDRAYGTIIGGEIIGEPTMMQQRDYTTGDLLFFPDGNPQWQLMVKLQTEQRDPSVPDDDGVRAVYIKGQLKAAVSEALKRVGEKVLRRGGHLRIKYLRDEPVTLKNGRPGNPQKIYAAQYDAPAAGSAAAFLASDEHRAQQGPVATSFATGGPTGGGLACPEGVDAARWADMNAAQQQQMYDALGLGSPVAVAAASGFRDEPPF